MKKTEIAQRQLVLCICDRDDLQMAQAAAKSTWADRIIVLHPEGEVPKGAGAAELVASDLLTRHGVLAGLAQIDAPLRRGTSQGRATVIARPSHCPNDAELALMEEALERSAREAVVTVGGQCLHLDLEEAGPTLFAGRLSASDPSETLVQDRLVHIPGRDAFMLDPDVGRLWPTDVLKSAVSLNPACVALATLLANRGIALIDFARPAPCALDTGTLEHFLNAVLTEALDIPRLCALLFQADLWNEARSLKRAQDCQCADVDLSVLRAAPEGTPLQDIPRLEPVFAAQTTQLGADLNDMIGQSRQRANALQDERARTGTVIGDVYRAEKPQADFDQVPALQQTRDRVIFSVATYHKRVTELGVTLDSIYDQADEIHVYLNDLETVPDYCQRDKIIVHRGQDFANLSAAGKMYFLSEPREGYIFIIDDDNVLPPDYVEKMIRLIELYKRRCAVTVHGSNMVAESRWYYRRYGVHAYQRPLSLDKFVNLPGSGTFAYHTDTLSLDFAMFQPYVLVDLAVAIACRDQGVPIVCARRPERWLKLQDSAFGDGLWEEFVVKPTIHSPAMLENGPWDLEHHAGVILPMIDEVFGDLTPEQMVGLGLDADFITKAREGARPYFWSAANNVFSVTGEREKNRIAASLEQALSHANALLNDPETASRYDAQLAEAYAGKDFSNVNALLMSWAAFSAKGLRSQLARTKTEWNVAKSVRRAIYEPGWQSLRSLFRTLRKNT